MYSDVNTYTCAVFSCLSEVLQADPHIAIGNGNACLKSSEITHALVPVIR